MRRINFALLAHPFRHKQVKYSGLIFYRFSNINKFLLRFLLFSIFIFFKFAGKYKQPLSNAISNAQTANIIN
jgi:hypothetical protein